MLIQKITDDLTDGKLTLLQDFWYSPFGQTVFHPGRKLCQDVEDVKMLKVSKMSKIKTTNSIKEYLLALCLQNDDGGLVIVVRRSHSNTKYYNVYLSASKCIYL